VEVETDIERPPVERIKFGILEYEGDGFFLCCDISGSMSNYSRMFLHFLHALMSDRDRVQVFRLWHEPGKVLLDVVEPGPNDPVMNP
jgi:hypothetical protein